MNGSHHRLGTSFDAIAHLGQDRLHGGAAKLSDISPRNECTASAHKQHAFDAGIGFGLVHRGHQAAAHIHTDGVDWGVINRDDQQLTVFGCTHNSCFRMAGQTKAPHCFILNAIVWQIIFLDNPKLY